jgi:hypothetical protein
MLCTRWSQGPLLTPQSMRVHVCALGAISRPTYSRLKHSITRWPWLLVQGPLHTQDREPVAITFQALSLVEKAEPIQVRFTLRLRDQRSMWMQDGCKVYMDSYMASNGSCFMVTWTSFKNHLLEGRPNTKPRDHGTLNLHNRWFIIVYHMRGPRMNRNSLKWHLVDGPAAYDLTLHLRIRDHTTWFWRYLGTAFGDFLLGSHNFMITVVGSCVKWF